MHAHAQTHTNIHETDTTRARHSLGWHTHTHRDTTVAWVQTTDGRTRHHTHHARRTLHTGYIRRAHTHRRRSRSDGGGSRLRRGRRRRRRLVVIGRSARGVGFRIYFTIIFIIFFRAAVGAYARTHDARTHARTNARKHAQSVRRVPLGRRLAVVRQEGGKNRGGGIPLPGAPADRVAAVLPSPPPPPRHRVQPSSTTRRRRRARTRGHCVFTTTTTTAAFSAATNSTAIVVMQYRIYMCITHQNRPTDRPPARPSIVVVQYVQRRPFCVPAQNYYRVGTVLYNFFFLIIAFNRNTKPVYY